MNRQKKLESVIYLVLWTILFAAPILTLYTRPSSGISPGLRWNEVFTVWRIYAVYLIVFLLHNLFIAPLLIYKHKKMLYLTMVTALLMMFQVYQCTQRPEDSGRPHPDFKEMERPRPGNMERIHRPMDGGPHMRHGDIHHPPVFIGQLDVVAFVIVFLMLGMNLGIKLYCKSDADEKRMKDLVQKNLEQQLEYLKYQINPHFFMNTLNNIHALVDIDPEKAKATIEELSKMMRYVLYEGAKTMIPLQREAAFIGNYITLMRLRYTDKVEIEVEMPAEMPEGNIPPLLLITFIENAFKHGVSYLRKSFISVRLEVVGDRIHFECNNSRMPAENDVHGGIGLKNVKKRLQLIYGDDYTFTVNDSYDIYEVTLDIPLK